MFEQTDEIIATERRELQVTRNNHDTIGMIAIDAEGNVAAGTSTNGASHKIPGLDDVTLLFTTICKILSCSKPQSIVLSTVIMSYSRQPSRRFPDNWSWSVRR